MFKYGHLISEQDSATLIRPFFTFSLVVMVAKPHLSYSGTALKCSLEYTLVVNHSAIHMHGRSTV